MHPAQLRALALLCQQLQQQVQSQVQLLTSIQQILADAGGQAAAQQRAQAPQMPDMQPSYLNDQEEAALAEQMGQGQHNLQQAFDAALTGAIPHFGNQGQRRMAQPSQPQFPQQPRYPNGGGF
jgi:hypothetical protein